MIFPVSMTFLRGSFLWLAALVLPALPAHGCTIPVFRFALDRWAADPLVLELPAGLAATKQARDLLRPLRANGQANLVIREVPEEGAEAKLLLPEGQPPPVWQGPLNETTLAALLDSPARQELARRILQGESVVWLLVDRGDAGAEERLQHLEGRLRFLEQVAALPPQDPNDPSSQLGPGPELKLDFSLQRVDAGDPREPVFVYMLAGPETALAASGQSFAAAVFGRGRVLTALPLEELDDQTLEDVSMFLIGRCSCQVKNQNPGWTGPRRPPRLPELPLNPKPPWPPPKKRVPPPRLPRRKSPRCRHRPAGRKSRPWRPHRFQSRATRRNRRRW